MDCLYHLEVGDKTEMTKGARVGERLSQCERESHTHQTVEFGIWNIVVLFVAGLDTQNGGGLGRGGEARGD